MVPARLENAHIWVSVNDRVQRSATECLASFSDIHVHVRRTWSGRGSAVRRTAAMLHLQAVAYQKVLWDFDGTPVLWEFVTGVARWHLRSRCRSKYASIVARAHLATGDISTKLETLRATSPKRDAVPKWCAITWKAYQLGDRRLGDKISG